MPALPSSRIVRTTAWLTEGSITPAFPSTACRLMALPSMVCRCCPTASSSLRTLAKLRPMSRTASSTVPTSMYPRPDFFQIYRSTADEIMNSPSHGSIFLMPAACLITILYHFHRTEGSQYSSSRSSRRSYSVVGVPHVPSPAGHSLWVWILLVASTWQWRHCAGSNLPKCSQRETSAGRTCRQQGLQTARETL